MRFFVSHIISEHIAQTDEGFLICEAVPIARTGQLAYGPGESPVEPGKAGVAYIDRPESEVFDPAAMASFEGKPVTINHPTEPVTPANSKELSVGHAQNVRRGEAEAEALLLADLVITDETAITLVRGGLREISCGYDAEYEQTKPGFGRQSCIRGNHIALVSRGRSGPRCRINDSEGKMKKKKFLDGLMAFFTSPEGVKVLDSLEEEKTDDTETPPKPEKKEEKGVAEEVAALVARINELEIQIRGLSESRTRDKEQPARDQDQPAQPDAPKKNAEKKDNAKKEPVVDAQTKARAHCLAPNMVVQDADLSRSVKRAALRTATARDARIQAVVGGILSGATLDSCDSVTLDAAFVAASEVAKTANNGRTADAFMAATTKDFGKAVTPADINKLHADFYGKGV